MSRECLARGPGGEDVDVPIEGHVISLIIIYGIRRLFSAGSCFRLVLRGSKVVLAAAAAVHASAAAIFSFSSSRKSPTDHAQSSSSSSAHIHSNDILIS